MHSSEAERICTSWSRHRCRLLIGGQQIGPPHPCGQIACRHSFTFSARPTSWRGASALRMEQPPGANGSFICILTDVTLRNHIPGEQVGKLDVGFNSGRCRHCHGSSPGGITFSDEPASDVGRCGLVLALSVIALKSAFSAATSQSRRTRLWAKYLHSMCRGSS